MRIDWFTVGAQLLNFLVLAWLLKRFLYKPILDAIDAREKRIAATLADAAAKKSEAVQERDTFRQKNETFDRERDERLSQARDEVKAERQRLLDEARQATAEWRGKREEALRREHENLRGEITRRTQEEVFAIARKTLTDLADASLEERMAELFVRRLRESEGEARESLVAAVKAGAGAAIVRSAFALPAQQQEDIRKTLKERFANDLEVRFETAPQVIGGIELVVQGRKVAWSIADYLATLEKDIGDLLKGEATPETKPEPAPVNASPRDGR